MDAMFEPLTPAEADTVATPQKRVTKVPIVPVPDDAPPMNFRLPKLGAPTRSWAYHDAEGHLVGYVVRWDTVDADGRPAKTILPISYCDIGKGRRAWRSAGMPELRPLFRLPEILASPEKPILVCEGEKTCDAAAILFPDMVATTPAHGAKSPRKTDFAPCEGRVVVIATDHDARADEGSAGRRPGPGRAFGDAVCELVRAAGAARVLHLHPERLAAWCWQEGERRLREAPIKDGWDLADALDEGWTAERIEPLKSDPAFLPDYMTAKEAAESAAIVDPRREGHDGGEDEAYSGPRFRIDDAGVWKIVERKTSDGTTREWCWFCSVLEVVADTRNGEGKDWGRLLRIVDRDGRVKDWAMPMELLAGDGIEYRRELLASGLLLANGKFARDALHDYISSWRSDAKALCVARTGWHGKVFVTYDGAIGGAGNTERVVFQSSGAPKHAFRQSGTLADWQQSVARYAVGNSRLALALSTAFAAPLLAPTGSESGGVHLRGASSTGKSTALVVAGSAWGGGGVGGYLRNWRATTNGTEGIAAMHCDALLCLDELGQVAPHEAGQIAYMLANGAGKTRANRLGDARAAAEWRLLFLSSGEVSLADKLAEDGRGRRAAAGQEVRIVDIPADAGTGMGIFETLHDFPSADALARHLKEASAANYGVAARVYIEYLARDFDSLCDLVKPAVEAFAEEYCPAGADGQVHRVGRRFGLVAASGELATKLDVLPWDEGEATAAAARCFQDWLVARGGLGSREEMAAVEQVRHFIAAHGAARFEEMSVADDQSDDEGSTTGRPDTRIQNRVGYRSVTRSGEVEYIILPENWKKDVCQGFDHTLVTTALVEKGILKRGGDGKPQIKRRLPEADNSVRCYVVDGGKLHGELDAPARLGPSQGGAR